MFDPDHGRQAVYLTTIAPDDISGSNRAERRSPRYLTFHQVADRYQVSNRTPENWVRKGYIHLFRHPDGTLLIDVDEVDRALKLHGPKKMRTGLTRAGAHVFPLPIEAEAVSD